MSKGMVTVAGGLAAADKEKLIPENIREGVVLFAGTSKEIIGTLYPAPESGTFVGYDGATSYDTLSPMLGGLSPGPVFSAPGERPGGIMLFGRQITTKTVAWFTNLIDFSKYSAITFTVWGVSWEGNKSVTFGVGSTTNLDEWMASTPSVVYADKYTQYVVDVSGVEGFGFIKWQSAGAWSQYITSFVVTV